MKRLAALLAIVVAALIAGPFAAAHEDPPFRLPLDRQPAIPYGLGMKFFYGQWVPRGRSGGDHAFSWSKERLMQVFGASCLASKDPKDRFPFDAGWN